MSLPYKRYSQMGNTCGLTAFLTMVYPDGNGLFKLFLDICYRRLETYLGKYSRDEFKWSVVLDYLILKSVGDNMITEFLRKKNPDIVDYYVPIKLHQIQDPIFTEKKIITKSIFKRHLHIQKTDVDLKILMYLFGGKYYPQPQEVPDSTGSLYFTIDDLRDRNLRRQKIGLIKRFFREREITDIPIVAINVGYHWIGANTLEEVLSRISLGYRFYFFTYNPIKAFILRSDFLRFINKEIEIEMRLNSMVG